MLPENKRSNVLYNYLNLEICIPGGRKRKKSCNMPAFKNGLKNESKAILPT